MKLHPKKIIKQNSKPHKSKKTNDYDGKKMLYDDYKEELFEYQMDLPGSYQGGSVWGGTGNYGFGGKKQIVNQTLNPATQTMADYEEESRYAKQVDQSEEFDEDYLDDRIEDIEDRLIQNNSAIAEAYPNMSLGKGKSSSFANLPGWPRTNTLSKQIDFIPDDSEAEEEQKMERLEDEWIDHLETQPQTDDKALTFAKLYAKEMEPRRKNTIKRNMDTPSNGFGYSSLANAKRFVPKELDQYSKNEEDILWTIGRKNST